MGLAKRLDTMVWDERMTAKRADRILADRAAMWNDQGLFSCVTTDLLESQCTRTLQFLGYDDLEAFFTSDHWQSVQAEYLASHPLCACGRPAELARVKAYTIKVLKGKDPEGLEAICMECA